MKKIFLILILSLIAIPLLSQDKNRPSFLRYYEYSDLMQAPDAAYKFGLYGFSNPAATSYLHDGDMQFSYSMNGNQEFNKFGYFTGSHNSGFGLIYNRYKDAQNNQYGVFDYRSSIAFGDRIFSIGLGYDFVGGSKTKSGRSNSWQWSFLYRPSGNFSISGGQTRSIDKNDYETNAQIAIRPIASYPLALFADASLYTANNLDFDDLFAKSVNLKNGLRYSYGVSWEVVDGIRVNGRMFSNPYINGTEINEDYYSLGFDLSLGTYGVSAILGQNSVDTHPVKQSSV